MFSGDWQPSTAVSEESWSEIDPKRSKFAQWFHSEGMKGTPHGVVLYSHTCFICVCALMVSADRPRPPKTALNNNHMVGTASALSHSAAEYAFP